MFYQTQYSQGADTLKAEEAQDFSYPAHMHSSFEIITVTEGEMNVTVDGMPYTLRPGMACLVFPNQIHSLETKEHSRHFLCIFSSEYVKAYARTVAAHVPTSNLFAPDGFYLARLLSLPENTDPLFVKGLFYSLCAEFHRGATYVGRADAENDLIVRIFRFVETSFAADCTLEALSENLSYHYVYLSKYFKGYTGISFTQYVNRYRVNEACYLLKNTDKSVLQTALDCGFDSLRSFNRNFKNIVGISPTAYRER